MNRKTSPNYFIPSSLFMKHMLALKYFSLYCEIKVHNYYYFARQTEWSFILHVHLETPLSVNLQGTLYHIPHLTFTPHFQSVSAASVYMQT